MFYMLTLTDYYAHVIKDTLSPMHEQAKGCQNAFMQRVYLVLCKKVVLSEDMRATEHFYQQNLACCSTANSIYSFCFSSVRSLYPW